MFQGNPSNGSRADICGQTDGLTSRYHFSRMYRFYGDTISPETRRGTWNYMFLTDFNQIWIFSTDFPKSLTPNFKEIRPQGAALITCGKTVVTKSMGAFRHYANAPKIEQFGDITHKITIWMNTHNCANLVHK